MAEAKTKKPAAKTEAAWFKRHDTDTGSPEYQIVLISKKVETLQGHLAANHHDYDAKRSLLKLVARRRQHLKYLKTHDLDKYLVVSKKTGLKV